MNARTVAECVFANPGHRVRDVQCANQIATSVKCTVANARRVDRNVECCRANVGTRRKARFGKRIALAGHRHGRVAFDQRCSTHLVEPITKQINKNTARRLVQVVLCLHNNLSGCFKSYFIANVHALSDLTRLGEWFEQRLSLRFRYEKKN